LLSRQKIEEGFKKTGETGTDNGSKKAEATCNKPGLVQGLRDLRQVLPETGFGTG
jgi:hypothetical protein